jgi:hypothetical protein
MDGGCRVAPVQNDVKVEHPERLQVANMSTKDPPKVRKVWGDIVDPDRHHVWLFVVYCRE